MYFFLTYLRWGDSALIEDEKELKVQKNYLIKKLLIHKKIKDSPI